MTRRALGILLVFTLVILLGIQNSSADELSFGSAAGINHAPGELFFLAYDKDLPERYNPGNLFFLEGVGAFYTEPNTLVGSLGVGARYEPLHNTYLRGVMGISLQSRKTERLGGNFQFLLKAGAGVRFNRWRLGPFYSHYSSGGIYRPNVGDDYVGLEIGVDLN